MNWIWGNHRESKHISDPISAGELNLIYLKEWTKATIGKLLWNVFAKKGKLWINWVHLYYLRKEDVATYTPKVHCSWITKVMFKHKDIIMNYAVWNAFQAAGRYETRKVYRLFRGPKPKVSWRNLFYDNLARPRVVFTL